MLKDQARHISKEMPAPMPETPEQLPAFPEGVTIPDDLSGLDATRPTRAATAVRWLGWIVLVAVIAVGAVVALALLRDDGTADVTLDPATDRVPSGSSFDTALVPWMDPATDRVPSGSSFDTALVPWMDPATDRVPSGSSFDTG